MTPVPRVRSAVQDAIWSLLCHTIPVSLVIWSLYCVRLLGKLTLKHQDLGLDRIQPSLLSSPVADLGFFLDGPRAIATLTKYLEVTDISISMKDIR